MKCFVDCDAKTLLPLRPRHDHRASFCGGRRGERHGWGEGEPSNVKVVPGTLPKLGRFPDVGSAAERKANGRRRSKGEEVRHGTAGTPAKLRQIALHRKTTSREQDTPWRTRFDKKRRVKGAGDTYSETTVRNKETHRHYSFHPE